MAGVSVCPSVDACCSRLPGRLWRLLAAAGVCYIALYGSDLAITHSLTTPLPTAAPEGQAVTPAAAVWAYVPFDPTAAPPSDRPADAPRLDGVVSQSELERNDLYRRVMQIRRRLGICCDATLKDGGTALPLPVVLDLIGGQVHRAEGAVRVINREGQVVLRPGSSIATRNFVQTPLPVAPYVSAGTPMVPLRSLCALYEASFSPEGQDGLAVVTYGDRKLRTIASQRAFHIEIDRSDCWVRVFYAGELAKHYPACTGEGGNTPVGEFHVQNRCVWPGWRAYWGEYIPGGTSRNPLGARFLGTSARGRVTGWTIGIHGTNQPSSIGRRISGGCVRLHNSSIIEVYEVIPIGTRVSIHE